MLTKKEIKRINRVRGIMARVEYECGTRRRETPENYDAADGYDFGKLGHCADQVRETLFTFLNVMNAHNIQKVSDTDLHMREKEETCS